MTTGDDDTLASALSLIQARIGIVVPRLCADRVELGLRRARAALKAPSLERTLSELEILPCASAAWQAMVSATALGTTGFLRHREWFAAIEETVLAPLIEARRRDGTRRIDLWSAGCSTGEEAYSLAMLIDRLLPDRGGWTIRIVGTDINGEALAQAGEGIYHPWSLREVERDALATWFPVTETGRVHIARTLKGMVEFTMHNICEAARPDAATGLAGFDLIVCRNVLVYFSEADRQMVARRLGRCLKPGGWLAVAPAEAAADLFRPYAPVSRPGAILFSKSEEADRRSSVGGESGTPWPESRSAGAAALSAVTLSAVAARMRRAPVPEVLPAVLRSYSDGAILSRVRDLACNGRHADARQCCESFLAANGFEIETNLLLATVCLDIGALPAALEAAQCAVYLDPESPAAHYMLGAILHRQGHSEVGLSEMAAVVRLLQTQPPGAVTGRPGDGALAAHEGGHDASARATFPLRATS